MGVEGGDDDRGGCDGPAVVKLGGSVVTRKDSPETLDAPALSAAAESIGAALSGGAVDRLVVVHGGGSFGHHHADAHGVTTGTGTRDAAAAGEIHAAMKRLNAAVLDELRAAGVPALPVHPLSAAARTADGGLTFPLASTETLLGEGFVPVLHGDGVAHAGEGVTVLSGDEIVVRLGEGLAADRVGVCSTVPGVLDADGAVIDRIDSFDAAADALGASDATDVSGGMAGKVRRLLALSVPARVFGADDLDAFLRGGSPGTLIG
jgi:isopentenyl phosphate kinase